MKKLVIVAILLAMLAMSLSIVSCDSQYTVHNCTVVTGEYSMSAKLTLPVSDQKVPAVVMVHGSGANDMDETVGRQKLFKDLAQQLANNGIASIRYDKRVYAYLEEVSNDYTFTIFDEVIDDAVSALKMLSADERIDSNNLFIVGHSFGGQLAPVIANVAKQEGINVKGIVSLAGTTEHIIDLAMRQLLTTDKATYDTLDEWDEYFRDIKQVKPNELNYFFLGAYQTYWVSYNNIDLVQQLRQCATSMPILILHGKLDMQVEHTAVDAYRSILGDSATYHVFDNLNHMFVDGSNATIATALLTQTVPVEVIETICNWVYNQ